MSDIFIEALVKTGIYHNKDTLKVFSNLLDMVGQIEPYTLFTSRTIISIEEQIFGDMDYISFVLSLNMFLEAMIVGEEKSKIGVEITAMLESLFIKDIENGRQTVDLGITVNFLNQLLIKDPKVLIDTIMNSWYKVIILMAYHESDIYDLISNIAYPSDK